MRVSSTETGHNNLDHILRPLKKTSSSNVGHKQETLGLYHYSGKPSMHFHCFTLITNRCNLMSGTLSDSGRNSMSSLPTHSTSGSLRTSTCPAIHSDGTSVIGNSLSKGQQLKFSPWNSRNNTNLDCGYRAGLNSGELLSKANEDVDSPLSADEPSTLSEIVGGIRSPITTDESLIEHLEQRLLERETELQELQVSNCRVTTQKAQNKQDRLYT